MSHEIISASAGTGKTHTLTKRVVKLIADGKVQADRMLITTFSIKAAEELRGRVRQELLEQGHMEAARKLPLSRIGTVNSLCDQFVRENAYELGVSPRVQVAEPEWIDRILEECIVQAATADELEKLADWTLRLNGAPGYNQKHSQWEKELRHIIDLARSNHVTAEGLEESKERSVQRLIKILPGTDGHIFQKVKDKIRSTEEFSVTNQKIVDALLREPEIWNNWNKVAKDFPKRDHDLKDLCGGFITHPQFQADMTGMIKMLFNLAIRTLAQFEKRKRELGVIDFIDQEVNTLQLLNDPEFLKENTGRFDLLMVDEFQDTSPLQLDIFLRLKSLVSRCIWVGDPKQAIYSFRGADPALMRQVMDHLKDAEEPPPLSKSWRSRGELCTFTSDLFVQAYETAQGFKEEKVRITAAPERGSAPEGCRASVEAWKMTGNKDKVQPATLAGSIRALLQEQEADLWVPKEQSDQLRLIQAKDVAVLCKYNSQCNAVAANLKALGIPVRIGNSGLLNEPEAAFLLACLTLWQEPKHSLSIRTLQRLLTDDSDLDADGWLENCLNRDEAVPGIVEDIRNLRSEHPHAGVEEAFLHLQSQINLFECCQRWGDAEQRLANLRRLYGHLQSYVQQCKGPGDPVTLAGFQIYLQQLVKDDKDETGIRSGNAVSVYTLHGSKGLEWPVVILFGWDDYKKEQNAFQVSLQTDGSFDVENPLSGRWIRYWPNPLSSGKGKLFDLCPTENQQLQTKEEKDWLNVAYVGMTRAASQLILTVPEKGLKVPYLALDLNAVEPPVPEAEDPEESHPLGYPQISQVASYPPARKTPSSSKGLGEIITEDSLGDRLPLTGKPDMEHLGNMLHSWFALTLSQGLNLRSPEAHLTEWNCVKFLQPESLSAMHDRLRQWIDSRFPKAGIHTELPFRYTEACGTEVNGTIDLAIETQSGWIIIDHKSFPGNADQTRKKAQSFAEQLACYAQALTQTTGKPVLENWIHLPVVGKILRVNHQKTV